MSSNFYRTALELVKAGQKEDARLLIEEELKTNPNNADAWLTMAHLAESRERAVYYTQQALKLRPDHQEALRHLHLLTDQTLEHQRERLKTLAEVPAPVALSENPEPIASRTMRLVPRYAPILVLAGIVVVGLLAALGFLLLRGPRDASSGGADGGRIVVGTGAEHEVRYRVSSANASGGFNPATLTYVDAAGNVVEESVNRRSGTITQTMREGSTARITVQDLGHLGTVTCEILVDGETWRRETAEGNQAVVTCEGIVGRR